MIPGVPGLHAVTPRHFLKNASSAHSIEALSSRFHLRMPIKQSVGTNAI
jgi:hypothetical protein